VPVELTVILEVVSPVDHWYVLPPPAVSVNEFPPQNVVAPTGVILAASVEAIVSVLVEIAVPEQGAVGLLAVSVRVTLPAEISAALGA
jgi:hypothetical protein